MSVQVITSREAAAIIRSGSTLCSQGMGGNCVAEELMRRSRRREVDESWIGGADAVVGTAFSGDRRAPALAVDTFLRPRRQRRPGA